MTKTIHLFTVIDKDHDQLLVVKSDDRPLLTGIAIAISERHSSFATVGLDDTMLLLLWDALGKRLVERGVMRYRIPTDVIDTLEEIRHAVFGSTPGDEPNVFADYDKAVEYDRKFREALETLRK